MNCKYIRRLLLLMVLPAIVLLVACSPESQAGGDIVAAADTPISTPVNTPVSTPISTPVNTPTKVPLTGDGEVVGPAGADLAGSDGRLSLSIPAGALANEVPIHIAAVPAGEWPDTLAALDPAAVVYALEPSGLAFDRPVGFRMTMAMEAGEDGSLAPPVAFVINDAGDGELIDLDVRLDGELGIAVISGTLEHFSWLVGTDGGLAVGLEQVNPKERKINSPWEAGVLVRNVTKKPAGIELSITVSDIRFEGLGEVEVVGTSSHHGFSLNSGEERKLDLPTPRWQCGDKGEGSYRVVVRAMLGGDLVSDLVQWRSELPIPSFTGRAEAVSYVVLAEASVVCVIPEYEASTQSGRLSVSGRVSDVNRPFVINGTFQGGSAELTFLPELPPIDGNLSPGGSFSYTGGGSGATVSGSGNFTLAGTLGQPLTLSFSGHGCADQGECADTDGVILLTPIEP